MVEVVYVEWDDAHGISSNRSVKSLNKEGALPMRSAGLFISEDEHVVRFCQDVHSWEDEDVARDSSIIPKKYVTFMKRWTVPTRRRS